MSNKYHLNQRCQKTLNKIVEADGNITITQLSKELGIGRRSVYYDLEKINQWLKENGLNYIDSGKKGFFVDKETLLGIRKIIAEKYQSEISKVISPEERIAIIICNIVLNHNLKIEDLMRILDVSRNTVFADIKAVRDILKDYHLTLDYENKTGYVIKDNTVRIRVLFFKYFHQIVSYYALGILSLDEKEKTEEFYGKLKQISTIMNKEYEPGVLPAIACYFTSKQKKQDHVTLSERDKEMLETHGELSCIRELFNELSEDDQYYLALYLVSSHLQVNQIRVNIENEKLRQIIEHLIDNFQSLACVDFLQRDALFNALYHHLNVALYRLHYGIMLYNPLLEQIRKEYSVLFGLTKKVCTDLEKELLLPIPDDEIAYICLHFGGYLSLDLSDKNHLNILVICVNGVATGNMIKREIMYLIPDVTDIRVIALSQYKKNEAYDVIISTVAIDNDEALIVHPILSDADRIAILRKCVRQDEMNNANIYGVINIAKKYIPSGSYQNFEEEVMRYLSQTNLDFVPARSTTGILHYLTISRILYSQNKTAFVDALYQVSEVLIRNHSIELSYIHSIIERTQENGPYMMITEGVFLAHAGIDDGVHRTDLSIGVFPDGVEVAPDRIARIILVLSAIDQTGHLPIISDIMTLFSEKDHITALMKAKGEVEIYKKIREILN